VNWGNKNNNSNNGSFIARGNYHKNDPSQKSAVLTIDIDSTDIYSRNNLWKIKSTSIVIDSNAVSINRFLVGGKDYYYSINGAVSENPADTLDIGFKGIDIIPLNYIITRNKSNPADAFSPEFRGNLNGNIILTNLYRDILMQGNLTVSNFGILGTEYGTLSINSAFDVNRKVVNINAGNNLDGRKVLEISGFYDPPSRKLNLTGIASKLSYNLLIPFLKYLLQIFPGQRPERLTW